jgi:rhodanese-related sulfurtransferase
MRSVIVIGVVCAGLFGTNATAWCADHTKDSLDTVKKAVAENKAVLVDVREKGEWNNGHIKDATSLPLSMLRAGTKAADVARILPAGKIIYCHCAAGVRSLKAADALKKLGYDVRALKPGYADLIKAGFPPAEKSPSN